MHKNAEQTEDLLNELIAKIPTETEVVVTFINLASAVSFRVYFGIDVAAQNMHQAEGVQEKFQICQNIVGETAILGHSERRAIFMKQMHSLQ
jgi:triosephosphate isomerase